MPQRECALKSTLRPLRRERRDEGVKSPRVAASTGEAVPIENKAAHTPSGRNYHGL
jgi:hypothetical protein